MSFQLKNTADAGICITCTKMNDSGSSTKEDILLYPGDALTMPTLAGSHLNFATPVDITFRQKKAIAEKLSFVTKTVKEVQKDVISLDMPSTFVMLKIKKVYEIAA